MSQEVEKDLKREFEAFTRARGEGALPPVARLEADLVASPRRLGTTYAGGAVVGYLVSLAICAQSSIGLSPLAWKTAATLHTIPNPWCAMACGMAFGVAPSLAAVLLLSRFQHRYLIQRMWWLLVLVPILGSLVMVALGGERDLSWHLTWMAAAIATPYLSEALAGWLLRQRRWRRRPEH